MISYVLRRAGVATGALVLLLVGSAQAHGPLSVATPQRPVVDTYFGTKVVDPYRWLENGNDPAVKAWAAEQTRRTRQFIASQPAHEWYARRLTQLSKTSTARTQLVIAGGHYVYFRQTPPEPQPTLVARDGLDGRERVLYDPRSAAKGDRAPAIESVFVALDGSKVAFTTQEAGAEEETLHVVNVGSGEMLADVIPHAGGGTSPSAVVWDADGKGFLHTRWPSAATFADAHFNIAVYHHALGSDPSSDPYVFGKGLPRTAELQLIASRDGKHQAAFVSAGDGVRASVYIRTGDDAFRQVATPEDGIGGSGNAGGAFVGDALYVVSTKRDSRGEIVAIEPDQTFATSKTIVSSSALVIEDFTPIVGGFITHDVDGGDAVARSFTADGQLRGRLPLPPQSSLTILAADPDGGDVIVGYQSYTTPDRWLRYDPEHNALTPTAIARRVPGDYSKVTVKRVLVPSLDEKVKIPLEIVRLPATTTGGTPPTILGAYGAYGIISRPFFIGRELAWLERGGVLATAMIRGGGEYGDRWHTAAKLQTKTVSSDDLVACAKWLAAHGYGNAKHIGISGGSAGGFLMGLAMTRNPDLYRAVSASVGFYDLLRAERTPNGAFNTPEFGTVKDPAQFSWMVKQSPYENVKPNSPYPAVLMTTGENDPRVDPYDSRKMIARLAAASSSGYPVLLLQKSGEGHGIGNSFAQRVDAEVVRLTFFDSQLR